MNEENAQVIYDLLDRIKVTDENRDRMEKIRKFLSESKFQEALDELQILQMSGNVEYEDYAEVKEKERKIKENTKMNIYYTVYGYLPIFYSRRLLLTNYFKYIDKEKHDNRYYIFNNDLRYMVIEHNYGTIIYSPLVNLLNKKEELNILDNLVIDLSYTDNYDIIDKYINNEKEDGYIGFYDSKTIYRLKGDKNE